MARTILITVKLFLALCHLSFASDQCPTFWTPWGTYCYRYFGARVSWHDAKHYCRTFGEGVDLVSIHSKQEQDFLYTYWKSLREAASTYPRPGMWIGLNDIEQHGHHKWTDGSPLDYRYFDRDQELQAGDVYFLWDWEDSKWNPKGKWHNEYDTPRWYFQFMCKMSKETGKMLREVESNSV